MLHTKNDVKQKEQAPKKRFPIHTVAVKKKSFIPVFTLEGVLVT